jgi:SsrA-binding protein
MWLVGAHIARYEAASNQSHEPTRRRKLLLHRKEIQALTGKMAAKGFTLVPLRLYIKGRIAKLEIGQAKGKKLYDKRESIIRRETDREMGRIMKERLRQ